MKRRCLALVVFGAAVWLATPQSASAFGHRSRGCGATSGGCGTTSYTVSYVDKKVTAYKCETETKDVKVTAYEWKEFKEDYKFMVCEPVVTKQKVKCPIMKTKEEVYKYNDMQMTQVKQMVKVCEWKCVTKDVERTVYDCVPVKTKQKRIVCDTICVPVQVTRTVTPPSNCGGGGLFARCCRKPDPCAPPPCPQTITCTVMQKQVVKREVEVEVCTYQRVPRKVVEKVNVREPNWIEKEVLVNKCVPVPREGKRTVCYYEYEEKEVDVHTTKMVEKAGTRVVKKCVPVEKVVKQTFQKMVPYETTVKVPVYTPCAAPAPQPCAQPCGMSGGCGGRARGGLFSRCCN